MHSPDVCILRFSCIVDLSPILDQTAAFPGHWKKNMLPVFNMVGATAADVTFKDVLGEEVGACT
jgi:hypothetical protein